MAHRQALLERAGDVRKHRRGVALPVAMTDDDMNCDARLGRNGCAAPAQVMRAIRVGVDANGRELRLQHPVRVIGPEGARARRGAMEESDRLGRRRRVYRRNRRRNHATGPGHREQPGAASTTTVWPRRS